MDGNRYARNSTTRLPRTPGSRAVYGERDEQNKMFRCRFCGWICHIDKHILGDGHGWKLLDAPVLSTGDRPASGSYYGGTETYTETVTVISGHYIKTVSGDFLSTVSGDKLMTAESSSVDVTTTRTRINEVNPDTTITIRTLDDVALISENDTISEYVRNHYTIASSGCPLCGSRNWK